LQTGTIDDARLTDRDAILVRTDLPPGELTVRHPRNGNFTNVIVIPSIGLAINRGWCSVDVILRGNVFRYICTHLEEETVPQLQILQAKELLDRPDDSRLPVIIGGDFNSDPLHRDGSLAYNSFPAAGFEDAWAVVHPADFAGGLTWGHDEFLADPNTVFDRRIDLMFFRGSRFTASQAEVIDLTLNRTQPPLWASDHAAVAVRFVPRAAGSLHGRRNHR
jgi:endonuclease/exonuclease/phosphatase family metal-dependent hydrolase